MAEDIEPGVSAEPEVWTTLGLLDHICQINRDMEDRSFCFLLGSGASAPSGIPTGRALVFDWLEDLQRRLDPDSEQRPIAEFATEENLGIPGFDLGRADEFYPEVYERRFRHDPEEGFAVLEAAMQGKEPSLGYSVLSQILSKTRHRMVVTTNFDNLVGDALSIYTRTHPLVAGHESLVRFVRPLLRRPLVAKIHRDIFLEPRSDVQGTRALAPEWSEAIAELFEHHTPIVIGYGGNDGGLMGFLADLPPRSILGGIYWCFRVGELPRAAIRRVIADQGGALVSILGFDELMLQLGQRLDFKLIGSEIEERATERRKAHEVQVENIQKRLSEVPDDSAAYEATADVRRAVAASTDPATGDLSWLVRARAENAADAEALYMEGLEHFPDSARLRFDLAAFLVSEGDSPRAIAELRRVIELDPTHLPGLGFLADQLFMQGNDQALVEAEEFYRKAVALDDAYPHLLANFAGLLLATSQFDEALTFLANGWEASVPRDQAAAEILWYQATLASLSGNDHLPFLGQLNTLLLVPFRRLRWSFDPILDRQAADIDPAVADLLRLAAGAILKQGAAKALRSEPTWTDEIPFLRVSGLRLGGAGDRAVISHQEDEDRESDSLSGRLQLSVLRPIPTASATGFIEPALSRWPLDIQGSIVSSSPGLPMPDLRTRVLDRARFNVHLVGQPLVAEGLYEVAYQIHAPPTLFDVGVDTEIDAPAAEAIDPSDG